MKPYLRTITIMLALAAVCAERAALPAQAQAPQGYQTGQFPPVGGAGALPEGQSYAPYGYPGVCDAAMPPGAASPAYGPCPYGPGCGPGGGPECGPGPYGPGCAACQQPGESGVAWELLFGTEWRVSAEAVWLQRSPPAPQTLFRNDFGLSPEVFNAQDLQFKEMVPGFRASVTRMGPLGCDLECVYTQVDAFSAKRTLAGEVFLQTDVNGGNFDVSDPRIENRSELLTAEGNLWRHVGEKMRFLLGFRWLEFDDHYNVDSLGAIIFPPTPVTLRNNSVNNLYGGQIGADAMLIEWERLTLTGTVKAGAYANACRQESREVDVAGGLDQSLLGQAQHLAFEGELDLSLQFEVIMDRLYFRAGYQVLWLDGVLLAPDQVGVNNFATNQAGFHYDSLLLHGAHGGMELRF